MPPAVIKIPSWLHCSTDNPALYSYTPNFARSIPATYSSTKATGSLALCLPAFNEYVLTAAHACGLRRATTSHACKLRNVSVLRNTGRLPAMLELTMGSISFNYSCKP